MRKLLKEPLLHFLLIGVGLFVVFGIVKPSDDVRESDGKIVISAGRIEQLSSIYAKTWQRPPSKDEMQGLIDDFILEEIYYRQAIKMGIDRDDTIIRRRLRQKVEFLTDDTTSLIQPTDEELAAYIAANADKFRNDSTYTFQQIYINPEKHGDDLKGYVDAQLKALQAGEQVNGDPGLIQAGLGAEHGRAVDGIFGRGFAGKLDELEIGKWLGPIQSGLGVHLIKLDARVPGEVPELEDIRPVVEREWSNQKRVEMRKAVNEKLREEYEIVIEWPAGDVK